MERQALRDAVVRYNADGLAGLYDRPKGRPQRKLTPAQEVELKALVLRGPDPERDGISRWTLADLCRLVEARFGPSYHPGALWKVLRRLGLSWQKARPSHPKGDPAAREAFKKGGLARL
jgi:transposase